LYRALAISKHPKNLHILPSCSQLGKAALLANATPNTTIFPKEPILNTREIGRIVAMGLISLTHGFPRTAVAGQPNRLDNLNLARSFSSRLPTLRQHQSRQMPGINSRPEWLGGFR
jgi:hypothetical protein